MRSIPFRAVIIACSFLNLSCTADPQLWTEEHVASVRQRIANPATRRAAQEELNAHAWDLLKMTMANSRRPDWYYKWCTIDQVYDPAVKDCQSQPRVPGRLQPKRNPDGGLPDLSSVLSSSYYNPAITAYLRAPLAKAVWKTPIAAADLAQLSVSSAPVDGPGQVMQALAAAFEKAQGSNWTGVLPDTPHDGMIIKPAWLRIQCPVNPDDNPKVGIWKGVAGWDPAASEPSVPLAASTLAYTDKATKTPLCVVNPAIKDKPGSLPLNDFFYFRSQHGNDGFVEGNKGGKLRVGDYLVLVGLHLITREQPDWVWTTFWFDPNPTIPSTRPDWVKNDQKLRHFNMHTTVAPLDEPVFNPYLEGRFQDGPQSHCMSCHSRAKLQVAKSAGTTLRALSVAIPTASEADPAKPQPPLNCSSSICSGNLWSSVVRAADAGK